MLALFAPAGAIVDALSAVAQGLHGSSQLLDNKGSWLFGIARTMVSCARRGAPGPGRGPVARVRDPCALRATPGRSARGALDLTFDTHCCVRAPPRTG